MTLQRYLSLALIFAIGDNGKIVETTSTISSIDRGPCHRFRYQPTSSNKALHEYIKELDFEGMKVSVVDSKGRCG